MLPSNLKTAELAELGRVVVVSAELENTLDWITQAIGDFTLDVYTQVLAGKSTIGPRIPLFREVALARLKSKKRRQHCENLAAVMTKLIGERNIVVHGLWSPGGSGGALAQLMLFDSPLSQLPLQAVSKKKNKRIAASQLKALADDLEIIEHSLRIFYRNYFSQPTRDRRLKREEKKKAALIAKYSK